MKRLFYKANLKDANDSIRQDRAIVSEEEGNLVSSEVAPGGVLHAPVLDIDFPAQLVPSSSEGHFHLYLDRVMTWDEYRVLLWTLWKVGIIEEGFYQLSIKRGATFVRKPGIKKEPGDINSAWRHL